MAVRLLKRNVAMAAKKGKNPKESSGKDSEGVPDTKAKRLKVGPVPTEKSSLVNTTASINEKANGKIVRVIGEKSKAEMTNYLNVMTKWCMGGAILAQYIVGAVKDLNALPKLKKTFHDMSAKLENDELKMQAAVGQVKPSPRRKKALDDAKAMANELEALKAEVKELKSKYEESQREIEKLGKLWEESADVYFHATIKQIKFLNPGVELRARGMSTFCVVEDGKWYHAQPSGNVECKPGDEEPTSGVIEADAEEGGRPKEKQAADVEVADPEVGGK
ncbi:putative ankycorbin isoform X1 [Sesbania bispinosa]|nr:putative ankycorbin isoform X1 [Sesbania bispinosa]